MVFAFFVSSFNTLSTRILLLQWVGETGSAVKGCVAGPCANVQRQRQNLSCGNIVTRMLMLIYMYKICVFMRVVENGSDVEHDTKGEYNM